MVNVGGRPFYAAIKSPYIKGHISNIGVMAEAQSV